MLKKFVLPITVLYTLALATVCLIKINNLPDTGISFADKIFHFLVYSVLTFLWVSTFFFTFRYSKKKSIVCASVFSIVFGIIIEVLQGSATVSRHTDVYDAIANTLGVLVMAGILLIKKNTHIKNI